MRAQWTSGARPPGPSGWAWWRSGRERKAGGEDPSRDEAERLLDLAAFADGRLNPEAHHRIAEAIACDPDAAADVAAAQVSRWIAAPPAEEQIIARAAALLDPTGQAHQVVLFPPHQPAPAPARIWRGATAWSGLAAAIALASWLGFDLGSGVTLLRSQAVEDAGGAGMFDPPPLVRDFNEGWHT